MEVRFGTPAAPGGRRVTIARGGSTPRFLAPDIVVFFRPASSDLAAVRVDPHTMAPRSEPAVVLDRVATGPNLRGCYDLSRDGRLIYTGGDNHGLVTGNSAVCWTSPDGALVPIFAERSSWAQPRLSPDGRHLVVREVETPDCILWNYDLGRGTLSRITFDVDAHSPIWNPADGKVIFRYDAGTRYYVAERSADGKRVIAVGGAGAAEVLSELRVVLGWGPALERRLSGK